VARQHPVVTKNRRRAWYGALALGVAAAAAVGWAILPGHKPTPPTYSGDVIERAQAAGRIRLVAFLDTQPDSAATPSRSQATEITSLLAQYGSKGLTAEIVDESGAARSTLTNTYYDWRLGDVRLSDDTGHARARQYGVSIAPTVLLLDVNGTVVARWNSYVLAAQAAQAIAGKLT
jgi:hypothetical protein